MAERTRLAAAGFFLALTLAVVPALLPVRFAGASVTQRVEPVRPLVQLRGGPLASGAASEPELLSDGVLQAAISQAAPYSYSVAQGDTLWKISRDAGVSVEALAAANHLAVGTTLHPGQTLVVPDPDGPAPALSIERAHTREKVQSGTPARMGSALQSLVAEVRSLAQPSEGLITSRFGWRTHPIFGTREFHTGVDIANRVGTPIRAAESGIVRFVGWMGGYGWLIVLAHPNGFETSYSHLSAILVGLGQRVARGEVLGRMGSSGWSTGPHLLFEVRRYGVPLDPLPFLQAQRGLLGQAADPDAAPVKPAGRPSVSPSVQPAASSSRSSATPRVSSPRGSAAPAGSSAQIKAARGADDASMPASKEHRVLTDGVSEASPAAPRPATEPY